MSELPRLATERLILRPFRTADAPAVERFAGAWEVADTTLNIPHPYPAGAAEAWIETHQGAWDAGERLALAISPADAPDNLIGAIGLSLDAQHARGELGYWISLEMWGRGYATEASHAIIAFGFDVLGLNRIQARHFLRNPASGRVLQKLGMIFEGVQRQAFRRWEKFEDVAVYAILAGDRVP